MVLNVEVTMDDEVLDQQEENDRILVPAENAKLLRGIFANITGI